MDQGCFLAPRPAIAQRPPERMGWGVTEAAQAPSYEIRLTSRECEVLELLCQRYTDPEIADFLFISPRTVNHHVGRILAKLGARNRREAGAAAIRHGLI